MSIAVAYTVVSGGPKTTDFIARFVSTWQKFPPSVDCDLVAICNGGPPNTEQRILLAAIGAKMFVNSNDGHDLGGYVRASKGPLYNYDLVLYTGQSCYFHRAGWLKRIADAKAKWGHGMYGPFATHVKRAHLQTTAFATCPRLLIEYPLPVNTKEQRYEFEHGERAYWRMVHKRGYPVKLVTWDNTWNPGQWRLPKNGLWSGDQSNLLFFSNHSERWQKLDPIRKANWKRSADRMYR